MLTISFDRRAGTARHTMPSQYGDYFASASDPYFDIARLMTNAGEPDGAAVVVDERGMACFTVKSIHACARRYRPNADDLLARKARIEARFSSNIATVLQRMKVALSC